MGSERRAFIMRHAGSLVPAPGGGRVYILHLGDD